MNINCFSNINAKYFKILKFQNLLKSKGFLDFIAKPICKIYNHTLAFCSNFVTDPKGRNKQVDEQITIRISFLITFLLSIIFI
jgi:hypothetical protein